MAEILPAEYRRRQGRDGREREGRDVSHVLVPLPSSPLPAPAPQPCSCSRNPRRAVPASLGIVALLFSSAACDHAGGRLLGFASHTCLQKVALPCEHVRVNVRARAYRYFGMELHDTQKVPIGLIHSSYGGSARRPCSFVSGMPLE